MNSGTAVTKLLAELRRQQQYRSLESFGTAGGRLPARNTDNDTDNNNASGEILSFCSNDYLGLAQHPVLKEAATYAIQHYGCSAASSRLLSGHLEIHQELEERLACWSGCYEAALSFGSGYLANCGILQAVLEPDAIVLFDRLNHASLVDGLRLAADGLRAGGGSRSSLQWQRYRHCDMEDLEYRLQSIRQLEPQGKGQRPIWLLSESLFSMDGDIAPLCRLARLAGQYQFRWIVDEAHGSGIYGPYGAGLVQALSTHLAPALQAGEARMPDFVTANFAKALGSYGGYCLCSTEWKEYLVNFCRSLIYSTALPPASAAAALAAIQIVERECRNDKTHSMAANNPGSQTAADNMDSETMDLMALTSMSRGLGRRILEHSTLFGGYLQQPAPPWGPIVPVILGANEKVLATAEALRAHNILVKAIRSPTVPPGTARLRFSLGLAHGPTDLQHCAEVLTDCLGSKDFR